jgi:hypothetical protein
VDNDRFDVLAKSLASPRSRRSAVSVLARSAFATLGFVSIREADAKRKKGKKGKKSTCKKGKTRCGKDCADIKTDVRHCGKCGNECEAPLGDQRCLEGVCVSICAPLCSATEVCCATECTDLTTDAKNCGQCGRACAENEICSFANCSCPGPRCPIPGSTETRCCPAADGVCCENGRCCAAGNICTPDERCCPPNTYSCLDGTCCPFYLNCANGACVEP